MFDRGFFGSPPRQTSACISRISRTVVMGVLLARHQVEDGDDIPLTQRTPGTPAAPSPRLTTSPETPVVKTSPPGQPTGSAERLMKEVVLPKAGPPVIEVPAESSPCREEAVAAADATDDVMTLAPFTYELGPTARESGREADQVPGRRAKRPRRQPPIVLSPRTLSPIPERAHEDDSQVTSISTTQPFSPRQPTQRLSPGSPDPDGPHLSPAPLGAAAGPLAAAQPALATLPSSAEPSCCALVVPEDVQDHYFRM